MFALQTSYDELKRRLGKQQQERQAMEAELHQLRQLRRQQVRHSNCVTIMYS